MEQLPPNAPELLATAVLAGIVSHLAFFKQYDLDKHAFHIPLGLWAAQLGLAATLWQTQTVDTASDAYWFSLILAGAYICSVWASMLVYRIWFHPLHHFPGPFWAKTTKFWELGQVIESGSRWSTVCADLHRQYGDYVRTGPRELTVFDADAIMATNGPNSKCSKGPWYEAFEGNLQGFRDKQYHHKRRRVWDRAFSTKALFDLAPTVDGLTDTFLEKMAEHVDAEKPMRVTDYFFFYTYDNMTTMAFGQCADLMKSGDQKWLVQLIDDAVQMTAYISPIAWIAMIFKAIPGMMGGQYKVDCWSWENIQRRQKMKTPKPDLFQYLSDPNNLDPLGPKLTKDLLIGEGKLIIIAGSDTTASTLTYAMLYMAMYPEILKKLQDAIDRDLFSSGTHRVEDMLAPKCDYLEAVINETLRLHPPVQSGVQRLTPPEGLQIGNHFIPGDTILQLSNSNIARDERYFVHGKQFIPERWTSNPELIVNKGASVPFQLGPYGCVGKNLALMELRSVISRTLHEYDVFLPPKFDIEGYFNGAKDTFTTNLPHLDLHFKRRIDA